MVSNTSLIICFSILIVGITNCNGLFNIFTNLAEVDQCRTPEEQGVGAHIPRVAKSTTNLAQLNANQTTRPTLAECAEKLCAAKQDAFLCQALACKLKYPSERLAGDFAILRCMKRVCDAPNNKPHRLCQDLKTCRDMKDGPNGQAKFIVCITTLFPKN